MSVSRFEIQENIHNGRSRLFFDISNTMNHLYTGNFTRLTPGHQSCLNLTAYVRVSYHVSIISLSYCVSYNDLHFTQTLAPVAFSTSLLQVERSTSSSNFQLDNLSDYPVIVSSSLTVTVSLIVHYNAMHTMYHMLQIPFTNSSNTGFELIGVTYL